MGGFKPQIMLLFDVHHNHCRHETPTIAQWLWCIPNIPRSTYLNSTSTSLYHTCIVTLSECTTVQYPLLFVVFGHRFYFPAQPVGGFTLNDLWTYISG